MTLEPAMDTVVAVNSTHNVSYTCRSDEEDLIWVVNEIPVWPDLRERLADIGVWTEVVEPGYLSLVMNPEGGEARELPISCMTYTNPFGRIHSGESSQTIWIISFGGLPFFPNFCSFLSVSPGAPGPVEDLELVYYSQSQLRLQWSRPQDQHPQISMTYTVTIRNAITGNIEWVWLCCNENEKLLSNYINNISWWLGSMNLIFTALWNYTLFFRVMRQMVLMCWLVRERVVTVSSTHSLWWAPMRLDLDHPLS